MESLRPPDWLGTALKRLSFLLGEMEIVSSSKGYCCMKHELEFGPVELDMFQISFPSMDPEVGKLIHDVLMQEARSAAKHRVIHMRGSADGFDLSIAPYKPRKPWKGKKEEPAP